MGCRTEIRRRIAGMLRIVSNAPHRSDLPRGQSLESFTHMHTVIHMTAT